MKQDNLIYAVGIYKGGGLQVLKEFLKYNKNLFFYFDSRLHPDHFKNIKNYKIVKQSIISLILNYIELRKINKNIFFVNGLPPLISFTGNIFVVYQNLNIFPPSKILRCLSWFISSDFLRYIFFKIGHKNVKKWFVLSPIAYQSLINQISNKKKIIKLNLFNINKKKTQNKLVKKYDFIYPADLKNHKNHKRLISALVQLSDEKIKPSFLITLTNYEKKKINFQNLKKKINLINFIDNNNRERFLKKLKQSYCLFFPSEHETIGLPIIEAFNNNLLIATSNEKYAKQFIEPDIVFNCKSIKSIKNTIKKIYLNKIKRNKENKIKNLNNYLNKKFFFKLINEKNNNIF